MYYIKVLAAFVFVVALMYFIGWVAKRFGGKSFDSARIHSNNKSDMRLVDSMMIDYKRKLVVVDYKGKGYMFMLSSQSETVVATDLNLDDSSLDNGLDNLEKDE